MKKKFILTIVLFLSAALTVSVFAQKNGGNKPPNASVNKPEDRAESLIENTEILVKLVAIKDNAVSSNEYIKADEGNKYISVQIVIENKGDFEWEVKPYNFNLKDAEGNVYEIESSVMSSSEITQPTLKHGVIDGGDFVKGWITFQTSSNVNIKSTKIRYEDSSPTVESTIKSGWIALSSAIK